MAPFTDSLARQRQQRELLDVLRSARWVRNAVRHLVDDWDQDKTTAHVYYFHARLHKIYDHTADEHCALARRVLWQRLGGS